MASPTRGPVRQRRRAVDRGAHHHHPGLRPGGAANWPARDRGRPQAAISASTGREEQGLLRPAGSSGDQGRRQPRHAPEPPSGRRPLLDYVAVRSTWVSGWSAVIHLDASPPLGRYSYAESAEVRSLGVYQGRDAAPRSVRDAGSLKLSRRSARRGGPLRGSTAERY